MVIAVCGAARRLSGEADLSAPDTIKIAALFQSPLFWFPYDADRHMTTAPRTSLLLCSHTVWAQRPSGTPGSSGPKHWLSYFMSAIIIRPSTAIQIPDLTHTWPILSEFFANPCA
jgi:hypothetical protein